MFEIKIVNDEMWCQAINRLAEALIARAAHTTATKAMFSSDVAEGTKSSGIAKVIAETFQPEIPVKAEEIVAETVSREAIKKELDALGVAYNERMRTPTLMEMLEKAKAVKECPPVEDAWVEPTAPGLEGWEDEPVKEEKAPVYTLEDVKKALGLYALKHGKETAIKVLNTVGGVARLSECPEEKYPALMEAIK